MESAAFISLHDCQRLSRNCHGLRVEECDDIRSRFVR